MASRSESRRPVALITGHDGFTGRYLATELESAGYRVVGLCHSGDGNGNAIAADLLDRDAVHAVIAATKPVVVVHLAAIAFVAHGDADAVYRVNVVGTRNLLEALAVEANVPRIVVLASSANVYGNAAIEPIDEEVPPSPANDYAVSKLAMEYMARLWTQRLPIVVARPFNYTGVGQDERFLIPKIVGHFRRGEREIELGNIHVWRDFSDVRDVARAYAGLVAAAPAGRTFNICSGRAHSLSDVLDEMALISGYQIGVTVNPDFVRSGEVLRLVGSARRLHDAIGSSPQTPLAETLRWMYDSMH